jgi:hypothetical protein
MGFMLRKNKKLNQRGFIPMLILLIAILVIIIVVVYTRVHKAGGY